MIESARLLTFRANRPNGPETGLILSRWSLILNATHTPPVLYSAVTHPFWEYVRTQNTPNPTPKHPFPLPELESGQNELPSGQPGPQLGKMFEKKDKTFREVGKKLYSYNHPC